MKVRALLTIRNRIYCAIEGQDIFGRWNLKRRSVFFKEDSFLKLDLPEDQKVARRP